MDRGLNLKQNIGRPRLIDQMNSDLDYTLTDHAEKDVSSNPASGDIAGCGLCVERSTSDPLAAQSCPVELLELQHLPDESYGADSPSDADEGQREITGALSGTVVDENNVPVYAIDVTLMPVVELRLQTATIKIHVRWEDGTPVERSNLLFHNTSFHDQGVIGDEAPQITNGEGEFVVPLGFEYYARAVAHCDAGSKIEAQESRPVQQFRIDQEHIPQELTFVVPSPPCKLWTPP